MDKRRLWLRERILTHLIEGFTISDKHGIRTVNLLPAKGVNNVKPQRCWLGWGTLGQFQAKFPAQSAPRVRCPSRRGFNGQMPQAPAKEQ